MESSITEHTHNGLDSKNISIKNLLVNKVALTNKNTTALSSSGTEALITTDSQVIDNIRTRLNELETQLKSLGLLN